jgi:formylglycine-generating enzyme required for sulfatase activity
MEKFISVKLERNLSLTLALIPSGTFLMGSPETEKGRGDDETLHKVTISTPFYIGICQITQKQWRTVMRKNPSRFKYNPIHGLSRDYYDDLPVERITWNEAQTFCNKLSELPAEKKANHIYRLPTEAEWEYACRAGTNTAFSCGDKLNLQFAWFDENSKEEPHGVDHSIPNEWELYGMHGNVYEWCLDWYDNYPEGPVIDPMGPKSIQEDPEIACRVVRGGCYDDTADMCRSAQRSGRRPSERDYYVGFRVALSFSQGVGLANGINEGSIS